MQQAIPWLVVSAGQLVSSVKGYRHRTRIGMDKIKIKKRRGKKGFGVHGKAMRTGVHNKARDLFFQHSGRGLLGPRWEYHPSEKAARMKVVPVVDTFGTWGTAATTEIQAVARAISSRDGKPYSVACQRVFHEQNFSLIRGMARNINAASCVLDCSSSPPSGGPPDGQ